MIPMNYNDADGTLTIGARQGEFEGMLKERTFRVVKVSADAPVGVGAKNAKAVEVKYNGEAQTIQL